MSITLPTRELKKGSTAFLILSLLEERARHGYDLARLIETRSDGTITVHAASLYPLLYKLERAKLIEGRWIEAAATRRRRLYRLTPAGRRALASQRQGWASFVEAIARVTGVRHA